MNTSNFKVTLAFLGCLLTYLNLSGQEVPRKSAAHLFFVGGGLNMPLADMADRFGTYGEISGGYQYMSSGNWIFGIDYGFHFGESVKEDALSSLRNTTGQIITTGERYGEIFQRMRGQYIGLEIGRLWQLDNSVRRGIKTTVGAGIMEHQIRITDQLQATEKIFGERKKGYDKLSRGLSLRQYVGYHHLSNNKRINYNLGLEFTQGFTTAVRSIDWNTGLPNEGNRLDMSVAIKLEWMLPFYTGKSSEEVYY